LFRPQPVYQIDVQENILPGCAHAGALFLKVAYAPEKHEYDLHVALQRVLQHRLVAHRRDNRVFDERVYSSVALCIKRQTSPP
jgi:hypothetical protein